MLFENLVSNLSTSAIQDEYQDRKLFNKLTESFIKDEMMLVMKNDITVEAPVELNKTSLNNPKNI